MVGDPGSDRGRAAQLTSVRAAYETSAGSWADGPERMYRALADALIALAGFPLAGVRILDLGAGTGVVGRAALAAGASQVVAADLAVGMLRRCPAELHPVACDALALPFRDRSFDLVLAGFSLSHLGNLSAGLAEARRVGRAIAASSFAPGPAHPAKTAVDGVLRSFGYRAPAWYLTLKAETEPAAGDPARLGEQAAAAGYTSIRTRPAAVPTGLSTPAELASWRLGMAHVAPFVHSLDPAEKARLRAAAESAVAGAGLLVLPITVLSAR
jgi:ubiquinone/menaquinone biosynthesis C-methylase UbiE